MAIRRVNKIKGLVPIKHALITVSDKKWLDQLVPGLIESCPGIIIYSSGGTYNHIKEILGPDLSSKHIMEVSEYTGMPETEGGLVKTLHHKLFLGYLTEDFSEAHQQDLKRENAIQIDLLVCNLYPFKDVVDNKENTFEDARGNIDVGGPSALRAGAKNWHRVMCLPLPVLYRGFLESLKENNGCTDARTRFESFQMTFDYLSKYDSMIHNFVKSKSFDEVSTEYEIV